MYHMHGSDILSGRTVLRCDCARVSVEASERRDKGGHVGQEHPLESLIQLNWRTRNPKRISKHYIICNNLTMYLQQTFANILPLTACFSYGMVGLFYSRFRLRVSILYLLSHFSCSEYL